LSYRGLLPARRACADADREVTLAYRGPSTPKRAAGGDTGASGRMVGADVDEGSAVIGYLAVLGVGYVLGTKAGRQRYEQIVGTYRAVTGNPATRSMIDAGRRKLADRVSPDADPKMVTLTEIDSDTTVVEPRQPK